MVEVTLSQLRNVAPILAKGLRPNGKGGSQAPLLDVTAPKYGKPDRKLTAFVELTCDPHAAALLDKLMDATPYSTLTQEDNNSSYNSPSETQPALELVTLVRLQHMAREALHAVHRDIAAIVA